MIYNSHTRKRIKIVQPQRFIDSLSATTDSRRYYSVQTKDDHFRSVDLGQKDDDQSRVCGKVRFTISGYSHPISCHYCYVTGICSYLKCSNCIAKYISCIRKNAVRVAKCVVLPKKYNIRIIKIACCRTKYVITNLKCSVSPAKCDCNLIKYIVRLKNSGGIIAKYSKPVIFDDDTCFDCQQFSNAGRIGCAFSRLISGFLHTPKTDQRLQILQRTGICSLGRLPPLSYWLISNHGTFLLIC